MKTEPTYREIYTCVLSRHFHFPFGFTEEVAAYFACAHKLIVPENDQKAFFKSLFRFECDTQILKHLQNDPPCGSVRELKYGLFPWRSFDLPEDGRILYLFGKRGDWPYTLLSYYEEDVFSKYRCTDETTIAEFWIWANKAKYRSDMIIRQYFQENPADVFLVHVELGKNNKVVYFQPSA